MSRFLKIGLWRNLLPWIFKSTQRAVWQSPEQLLWNSSAPSVLVVARGCCYFKRFDFRQAQPASRAPALSVKMQQISPFKNTKYFTHWHNGFANVWFWDQARLSFLLPKNANISTFLPEAVFQEPGNGDQIRLLSLSYGFEAQAWQSGQLLASRFWPTLPSEPDWCTFLKGIGYPLQPIPNPLTVSMQEQPWAEAAHVWQDSYTQWEAIGWKFLRLAACTVIAWFVGSAGALWLSTFQTEQQIKELTQQSDMVLQERNLAITALSQVQAIAQLKPTAGQMEIFYQFEQQGKIPLSQIKEWRYVDGRIQANVALAGVPATDYVQRLEQGGMFKISDIKRQPNDVVQLVLTIHHLAEQGQP